MRMARTGLAAIGVAALLAGCAGEAAVQTEGDAVEAIVDTVTDSWTAELTVDVEITDAHVDALLDLVPSDPSMSDAQVQSMVRTVVDMMRRQADQQRSILSRGEDGSFRMATVDDGTTVSDIRVDVTDLIGLDTLTPDVTLLLQFDIGALLEQQREMMDALSGGQAGGLGGLLSEQLLRQQAATALPEGTARDVVLAILDGEFGGATGALDLTAFGVTEDDLADVRTDLASEIPFGGEQVGAILDEAITLRDLRTSDGVTTATLDVHPRAAVIAISDQLEASGVHEDARAEFERNSGTSIEDVPETIEDVATLQFDAAGHLVGLTIPVLDIVRHVVAELDDVPAKVTDGLAALEGARFEILVMIDDVGEVPSVLDVDAVTTGWADLVTTFEGLSGGASSSGTSRVEIESESSTLPG